MGQPEPTLTVITDRKQCAAPLPDAVRKATIVGGADVVQLRENDLSEHELLDLASALKAVASEAKVKFIVNHCIDVALACGADGVHLGWRSLKAEDARKALGAGAIVGVSAHSLMEILGAEYGGADYVHYGPIFDTPSKRDRLKPLGLDAIRAAKAKTTIPIVAVGGINEANAADVIAAGADGIAVISAVMAAPDAQVAASHLKREIEFGLLKRRA